MLKPAATLLESSDSRRADQAPVQIRGVRLYWATLRRFLVIAAIAWWLGGFTFYGGVAIPMGVQVLGTHRAVGFVTERVTNWLNVGGVIALSLLLWNVAASWNVRGRIVRYALLVTWMLMAAIEIELITLHPVMDRLLTTHPVREILDQDRFDFLHHVYLISSSVQWALGAIHVWCICLVWQPAAASRRGQRLGEDQAAAGGQNGAAMLRG